MWIGATLESWGWFEGKLQQLVHACTLSTATLGLKDHEGPVSTFVFIVLEAIEPDDYSI
jgi:hypothetical protein